MMRALLFASAALLCIGSLSAEDAPVPRPGIVLMEFSGLAAAQSDLEKGPPEAVVFTQAVSQGDSVPSGAASLLTSQYVQSHGLAAPGDSISSAAVTAAEVLAEAGYSAAAFSSGPGLDQRAGLGRGFHPARFQSEGTAAAFRKTWEDAAGWLSTRNGPFFLYIHGERPAAECRDALQALRRTAPAGTVLVLTAAVGPGGGPELGDRSVHVPLLVWHPGLRPRRVSAVVRLVDLTAALLEWAGAKVPSSFQGASLADLADGKGAPARYGFSASGGRPGKPALFSIRSDSWQMLYDHVKGEARLYDIRSDPGMKEDVSETRPETALDLTQRLMRHIRETRSSSRRNEGLSPELLRQMREKGYW